MRAAGGTRLVMFDGMAQSLQVADRSLLTTTFDDFAYDLAGLAGTDRRSRRDPREMPTPALLRADAETRALTGADAPTLRQEGHSRFADALAALGLPLLALGFLLIGGYSRFGLWRQVAAAVGTAVLLRLAANVAEATVRSGGAPAWAIYAPALATLALGAALVWGSTRAGRPAGAAA